MVSEKAVARHADMENSVSKCGAELLDLLDRVEDADINDIVEVICNLPKIEGEEADKAESRKLVAARMVGKSLQAGDAVFEKVSNAVYSALRGVVLGGSGARGRKLAEMALTKVGSAFLTDKVVETAAVLIVASTISVGVHGPWYKHLADNM